MADLLRYFDVYRAEIAEEMSKKVKINKLKQLLSFIFKGNAELLNRRQTILTFQPDDADSFMQFALPLLKEGW